MSTAEELAAAIMQCTATGGPICEVCPMYNNDSPRDHSECFRNVARSARKLILLNEKEIAHLQLQVRLMSENYTIKYSTTAEGFSMTAWPRGEHEGAENVL